MLETIPCHLSWTWLFQTYTDQNFPLLFKCYIPKYYLHSQQLQFTLQNNPH